MRSVRLLFLVGVVFIGITRSEPADEYRKSCRKTFQGSLAVCMDGVLSPDDCQDMFLQNVSKCVCNNMSLEIVRLRSQVEELRQQEVAANCNETTITTNLTSQITPTTNCSGETIPETICECNCEETIPTTTMCTCSSEETIPTPTSSKTIPTTNRNLIFPTTDDNSPISPTTTDSSPASSTTHASSPTFSATIAADPETLPSSATKATDSETLNLSATTVTDPETLTSSATNDPETLESGGLQGYGTILLIVGVLFLVVAALAYVAYQRKEQMWDLIFSKTKNGNKRSHKHKASHYTALPQTLHDTLHND